MRMIQIDFPGLTRHLPPTSKIQIIWTLSISLFSILLALSVFFSIASESYVPLLFGVLFLIILLYGVVVGRGNRWIPPGRFRYTADETGIWLHAIPQSAYGYLFISIAISTSLIPAAFMVDSFVVTFISILLSVGCLADSGARLRDRRRLGFCADGLLWRTQFGKWELIPWDEVGRPFIGPLDDLVIPITSGAKSISKVYLGSDIRVVWGLIMRYSAEPWLRRDISAASVSELVSSGSLPLP